MEVPSLALFAYAFPHRKTHDFIVELILGGYRDVCVIAAPWRELKHADPGSYFPNRLRASPARDTSDICNAFGLPYFELPHDDAAGIAELKARHGFRSALIAGARILKRPIIDLFEDGVVNLHPGKLPDSAGLDVFYHTIRTNAALGVTTHFIDHRVDAGRQIFFEETAIGPDDDPETVSYNNYQTQIHSLRRLLNSGSWRELECFPIDRPRKNSPMTPDEKREMLARFPIWRNGRHHAQQVRCLLDACQQGDRAALSRILTANPGLLECRSPEGWTPLIVAAFHQQAECVRFLLDAGADPNAAGRNGTTVLMYAKTALLKETEPSLAILEMLIGGGADISRHDAHGRDILHYVRQAGNEGLAEWLTHMDGHR